VYLIQGYNPAETSTKDGARDKDVNCNRCGFPKIQRPHPSIYRIQNPKEIRASHRNPPRLVSGDRLVEEIRNMERVDYVLLWALVFDSRVDIPGVITYFSETFPRLKKWFTDGTLPHRGWNTYLPFCPAETMSRRETSEISGEPLVPTTTPGTFAP
jgi:hypothetical protein